MKGNNSSPWSRVDGSDRTSAPCVKAYSISHRRRENLTADGVSVSPEDASVREDANNLSELRLGAV